MVTTPKIMVAALWVLLISLFCPPAFAETNDGALRALSKTECVILLHGLGRNHYAMDKMAGRLEALGYTVWNEGYPSTEKPIQELVTEHLRPAVLWAKSTGAKKVHFITHSLGGIMVRAYLQENTLPSGSRVVMLSPPNHGSKVVDFLKSFPPYRWFMGPAGQQLGTASDSIPNQLKPVNADIGIIAGTRSMEPWFSLMLPGKDDGKVSVESTKLSEMKDFLTVKSTHPFIMQAPDVIDQAIYYLQNGQFLRIARLKAEDSR